MIRENYYYHTVMKFIYYLQISLYWCGRDYWYLSPSLFCTLKAKLKREMSHGFVLFFGFFLGCVCVINYAIWLHRPRSKQGFEGKTYVKEKRRQNWQKNRDHLTYTFTENPVSGMGAAILFTYRYHRLFPFLFVRCQTRCSK